MGLKFLPCFSFILLLFLSIECTVEINALEADNGHDNIRCPMRERQALLKLKAKLRKYPSTPYFYSGWRFDSWGSKGHEDDCCKWSGVECSNTSGHVTGLDLSQSYDGCMIDPSLHELQQLSYLNLSGNYHSYCQIPPFFGNLTKLVQLDLSNSTFGGRIPHELGNLSMLEFLDLSNNHFNESSIPESLGFLKNLLHLDISSSFGSYPLEVKIPYQLKNLSRLQFLDLGVNYNAYVDDLEWLSHLHCLRYLDLQHINLSKAVDWVQTIMNLPQLTRLHLGDSALPNVRPPNPIPKNVSSSLSFIDLSENGLNSSIFQWIFNLSSSLSAIYLQDNSLQGPIPHAFGKMPSLIYLDLSNNELEGDIPTSFGCTCSSLRYLVLRYNRLKGDLSHSIRRLHKLRYLDLSSNSFYGIISEDHLNNFSSLKHLFLDSNPLTLHLNPHWIPPFQLFTIVVRSCNLGPQFPSWLKTQTSLYVLDISSNQISGIIPNWFWNLSSKALYLNISNNEIYGMVPRKLFSQNPSQYVDLSSNRFEGQIPLFNHRLNRINLSKNKFSGSLSSLCQFKGESLFSLDLSENSLSGELPNCWSKKGFGQLFYMNLSNNSLTGRIPNSLCPSRSWPLIALQLRNNNFSGELPSSLSNCFNVEVLDVANNMISGSIPEWIGDRLHQWLSILILRSNRFSGRLPSNLCWLQNIQIIDISLNNISGRVPNCLSNSTALTDKSYSMLVYVPYIVIGVPINDTDVLEPPSTPYYLLPFQHMLYWKGTDYEYKSINNIEVKTVDFSSNNLQGEIPEEFGSLVALVQLNLSKNNLSGRIPHRIGEMSMLEVLDLSGNHLSGEIPQTISNLSFLSSLDLSDNSLSGRIPIGTQIQTQSAASFIGNPGLCGDPLPKKCHENEAAPPSPSLNFGGNGNEEEKEEFISKGFYTSMASGFVIGFWGVLGLLLFQNFWSSAYFRFLDGAADWIYGRGALVVARIQRRLARQPIKSR